MVFQRKTSTTNVLTIEAREVLPMTKRPFFTSNIEYSSVMLSKNSRLSENNKISEICLEVPG